MNEPTAAPRSLDVADDQPLIGLIVEDDGREVVGSFSDEDAAAAAIGTEAIQTALSAIGSWRDLDWDEMVTNSTGFGIASPSPR